MRRQITAYFDDLDGSPIAEADLRTRSLVVDGTPYEWDLGPASSALLDDALRPFLEALTRQGEPAGATEAPGEAERLQQIGAAFLAHVTVGNVELVEVEGPPPPELEPEPAASPVVQPPPPPPRIKAAPPPPASGRPQHNHGSKTITRPGQCPACDLLVAEARQARPEDKQPEPPAEPQQPEPPAPAEPGTWHTCSVEDCTWPGSAKLTALRGHERMVHGIGGLSAEQMQEARRAKKKADQERAAAEERRRQEEEVAYSVQHPPAPRVPEKEAVSAVTPITVEPEPEPLLELPGRTDPPASAPGTAPPEGKTPEPTQGPPPPVASKEPIRVQVPKRTIEPGVNVVSAGPKTNGHEPTISPIRPDAEWFDWSEIQDLEGAFVQLRDRLRTGLPEAVPFTYYPEVLAMEGMDFDSVEAAMREPERVEVAPQSFEKGYAVLRFVRGDVMSVLGFRDVTSPQIIAAYHNTGLTPRHGHTTGGGGSRGESGLPKTSKQLVSRLRGMGATVTWDEVAGAKVAAVEYKGNDLGKVSVGEAPRATVETDYQRTVRRMEAIDRRVSAQ